MRRAVLKASIQHKLNNRKSEAAQDNTGTEEANEQVMPEVEVIETTGNVPCQSPCLNPCDNSAPGTSRGTNKGRADEMGKEVKLAKTSHHRYVANEQEAPIHSKITEVKKTI